MVWDNTPVSKNILVYTIPIPIWRIHLTGLLIFRAVVEPQNSGKSAKSSGIHKNTQNTAKFGKNLIKYMPVQHIWNLSQLLVLFTCRKLATLSWNFVTDTRKQGPKTTRRRLCCKNQTQPDSREMGRFFREFVPKNPAKFAFFPRPTRSPDLSWENLIKDQRMFSLWWSNYYWFP